MPIYGARLSCQLFAIYYPLNFVLFEISQQGHIVGAIVGSGPNYWPWFHYENLNWAVDQIFMSISATSCCWNLFSIFILLWRLRRSCPAHVGGDLEQFLSWQNLIFKEFCGHAVMNYRVLGEVIQYSCLYLKLMSRVLKMCTSCWKLKQSFLSLSVDIW